MAEEIKRKRGRPKKIPTVIDDVKPKKKPKIPKEIQDIINKVHGTVEDPMKEAVESLKPQKVVEESKPVLEIKDTDTDEAILGKVRDQSGWDVKKEDPIPYFDANLSYELTGYKPINKYRGLDFNPSWFTEARDTFVRTGHYTRFRRNSRSWRAFWKEQFIRCKYGMTSHGYTITGDHYYFLNFYRLKDLDNVEEAGMGRQEIFPNFLEGQYEWFHYLKLARKLRMNACMMKARGAGYSEIEASIISNSYNVIKGSINVCTAFAQTQLDKLLEKVWANINWLYYNTDGGMAHLSQAKNSNYLRRASHYEIRDGQKIEVGWGSQIQGIITDKPGKLRGDRTDILMFEECGLWPQFTKAYTQADALVGQIGRQWGLRLMGGTGGETGPQMEGLRKMYYEPQLFGVLPYRHNFTKNGEYAITSFFLPAFRTIKELSLLDSRGWLDDEDGKAYFNKTRDLKAQDPEEFTTFCAEYCFDGEEAFSLEGNNKFNKILIAEQLANIRIHKDSPKPERGTLEYIFKNGQHSRENITGLRWIKNNNGDVQIIEHPIWTQVSYDEDGNELKYEKMNGLYVAGIDSIDLGMEDTSALTKDPSNFCIVIKRRQFGLKDPTYVAIYKARPNDVRDAYKTAIKLLQYYNCKANLEATRVSMLSWAREKKYLNYFMYRPVATYPAGNNPKRRTIGTPASVAIIDHQTDLIRDYVNDFCHNIWFEEMLDELSRYTDEMKRKFDIIAAMGLCELGDEDMMGVTPRQVENTDDSFQDFGYYIDPETGYRRQGMIPKKIKTKATINSISYDNLGIRTSNPRGY